MKRITAPILLLAASLLASCHGSNDSKQGKGVPLKYVYVDRDDILHTLSSCCNILEIDGTRAVEVYPVSQINNVHYGLVCATCVDEEYFEKLHIGTESKTYIMPDHSNLKRLYENVMSVGIFDMPSTYEEFEADMAVNQNMQNFYTNLRKDGSFGLPTSYQQFRADMGFSICDDNL